MVYPTLSPLAKVFTATTQMVPQGIKAQLDTAKARGMTQSSILAHCLRIQQQPFASTAAEAALLDAVIVGLDAEWYEYDSSYITELGVSIIAPEIVEKALAGKRRAPWDIISYIINYHVCIKDNIHMVNSELCPGYPDKFQFGTTTFVSVKEAQTLLRQAFLKYDANGQPRPIVFVGHAVDNDIEIIKDRFDFDIHALNVVVATIDTQVLAAESGHVNGKWKISLRDLLCRYDIDEEFLHNAGNDTVCTMIIAVLMAFQSPMAGHSAYYKELKRYLHRNSENIFNEFPQFGTRVFCRNCTSNKHFAQHCPESVFCRTCLDHPTREKGLGHSHRTWQCLEHYKDAAKAELESTRQAQAVCGPGKLAETTVPLKYPVPCSFCIESTDPDRYTLECAYSHLEKDCDHQQ
ncbi:hypothetical protein HBI56_057800 [Parastagonospora nodorum]|uniref:Gfd2/YDR514C-like C-terminal domain-containing protein n=2 Tax=Phaeosphaeria nodorum (strain SN15 / ATCC MYA-4574 / FGSC 10173) TaxID=321614 RepID=A0A7U2IC53_PHANO|nr:hypothetical protein SNOG_12281 [Parastagonospora nodorum SN15]KAH3913792.1 hypothetical protein HBH56_094340 [Parastagonospora nodorum]EAT80094.2 hypothetical protein SNOG_12281 [Parastagonospora nodorum SN15]KAH3930163.1 hypothetical protein HBH54_108660 [Parastagonospora nodorum]KAH3967055.1 hypothetical protein HBH51_142220 [Parastagonospora nodorum]KAH4003283.1 hypothetical protein HBI10_070780 [Parastagonospora nodorum]